MIFLGCHALALDLVSSWSFARPSTAVREGRLLENPVISAPAPNRPLFPLGPAMRRRSSILIDMDIVSLPPTRKASPTEEPTSNSHPIETIQEENDLFARKAGLGNLMKSAKHDVNVPEFDMNAFF